MQGNARRIFDKRCDGNNYFGKLSKLGLAPILWCISISLLVTYISSVVTGTSFSGLTVTFALVAWLGVFLASSGLVMFYRCSRCPTLYLISGILFVVTFFANHFVMQFE
ncbi:S-acyltransferase TIP1 [Platanthera guangdongensis]|uniref:S-acyltransferase TIP1 n=1 Tax=Platanthera guangdongensis TaxID=2320717 RepID=A0ABR2MFP8_9ASPA